MCGGQYSLSARKENNMEETFSEDTRTTEEPTRHHLTWEEQLAQLEAKETEARRKAKIAKLRSALLSQKRETFDKVLSAHGIQTKSQLQEAMALYAKIRDAGITTPEQLDKLIDLAPDYNPNLVGGQREGNQ